MKNIISLITITYFQDNLVLVSKSYNYRLIVCLYCLYIVRILYVCLGSWWGPPLFIPLCGGVRKFIFHNFSSICLWWIT